MNVWIKERREAALAEAASWMGTPHRDRMAVRGQGVDCIRFVFEVLIAAPIVSRRELPPYSTMIGYGKESRSLQDSLLAAFHCVEFDYEQSEEEPQFGDIIVFKNGDQSAHCGWFSSGQLYHALARRCVTRSEWKHWAPRAKSIIRIYALGWRGEEEE